MATSAHAQAVKSLNTSSGRQRFVFKTFSQRIGEVDIDVYRSLDKVKSEPSHGSSFFLDCLTEWRELNTAEDFISFYEEMIPLVQTLPLVIFHKETIMSELLSRLKINARLSLEPILRLIAALSRDLLDDFLPFLPNISKSIVSLLESGADREPEIIEQIFTSWSSIMMYLQKYLVEKLVYILKATVELRYYQKEYVQDFMAEAVSFLFRNASFDQLKKGVWKIMLEVVKKPLDAGKYGVKKHLDARKYGVSTLLRYAMRGASSRLHSKAERVLRLLMSDLVLGPGTKLSQGSDSVVEVLILVFKGLCETIEPKELSLMWRRLYAEITVSVEHKHFMRLNHLLSLLISTVQINDAKMVLDSRSMVDVVALLLQTLILPLGIASTEDYLPEIFDKVLKLMLCTLDVLHNHDEKSTISGCSLQWSPAFELKSLSLLNFVRKVLLKDHYVLSFFRVNILSAMCDLIETSQEEVVYLLHSFCERHSIEENTFNLLDGLSEERLLKIRGFLRTDMQKRIEEINVSSDSSSGRVHGTDLALLWGTVTCVPFLLDHKADSSLQTDLIDAIDRLLIVESDNILGVSRTIWQSIIGAALSSHSKLHTDRNKRSEETSKFLYLARRHNSSLQVLTAVAEFLDSVYGSTMEAGRSSQTYHPELSKEKTTEALTLFADNLHHSEKGLRVAALRILCHFEPLMCDVSSEDQPAQKKMKTEASQIGRSEIQSFNVLQLLLSVATTPHSVSTSRKVILLISRIHMALSAGKIAEVYLPLLLSSMIGVFYNRFSYLWNPASECLAVLVSNHTTSVWEKFITHFEQILFTFQTSTDKRDKLNTISSEKSSDLVECYNSFICPASDCTPLATILSSLLQSLQRIPNVVDSRSRYIVPLFFKFLGYCSDRPTSVGSFNSVLCRGKEWKSILKEWLNLLTLTRNLRSFHQNQFLKDILEIRLLDANDPDVQMKVLDCLLIWGDKFLVPYGQHLKKLISFNSFREELTTWSLSRESELIEDSHRAYIVPIVIRILMPKVRKLKKHSSRKNASVNYRKAVLAFLAQLDIDELPLFFALLIKPLQIVSVGSDGASDWLWTSSVSSVDSFQASDFLKYFTVDNIATLSWKKISGFLHVIEDVLGVLDGLRIRPFLKFLMGCVVRILGSCGDTLDAAKVTSSLVESQHISNLSSPGKDDEDGNIIQTNLSLKQSKELRSFCVKIVSLALNKYEDYDFGDDFWDLFFVSVKPLVDSFKQEGSSSEKPTSLFSCFVAMSRSQKLVPLLYREKNLVPDIFGILTVSSASESILRYVFKFIENLLSLSTELDDSNNDVKRILLLNLQALTDSLHGFFKSESATKRKLVKCPGETERRIFKLLSEYIKDPLPARKFIDILLPFLENGAQNSDVCCEVVQIIRGILPVLGSEITTKILNAISPLFVYVDRDIRLSLCDLLDTLSQVDSSVNSMATLMRDLNANSAVEVGGLDYDTIVNAYEKINADFFCTVHHDQTLVILSQCVFDMSSQELILRHSAYRLLLSFVEFAALILTDRKDDCKMLHSRTSGDVVWTGESVKRIISKFLFKHLGSAMKGEDSVKREWINLLREMVLKLPNVENLNSLKILCNEDAETDFFNNIVHLQRHRRARALLRLKNVIGSCFVAERIMSKVFLPLFFNILFEVHEGKGEHVRNACIEAITAIAGQMRWDSYFSLLMRCFNEVNLNPHKHKAILRLICSVLDEFHFSVATYSSDNASASETILSGSSVTSQKVSDSAVVTEVQASLQKAVLPKIQKILDSDSDKINVNISLAALKVLKLLPGDIMDSQLSSIVNRISNFLKNRKESLRDEARSALAACLKELGLEYLQFIVKVLRATLKRGYELHVLGYTLNFILSKFLLSVPANGKLDYCVKDLLYIVENDILGDVAEEKEVEKIASKMKETRKRKSFETLQLIAQNITFKSHALKVLTPVTSQLQKKLTPKVKTKLESMLSHIAAGFECNTSVDHTDLFVFIFGLIEDGINKEESKDKNLPISGSDGDHTNAVGGKNNVRVKAAKTLSSHLITVFALGMLHKSVKNVDKNDLKVLAMLDPFVPLLGNCLHSRYEDVLSTAFRGIIPLLRLPLPSIESQADKIKGALFDIAQSSVNANSSLVQSCLKLLTVLLGGTKVTLSSEELHLLIQLPIFVDLERNPSFVALSLLKAIVNRKLVVPELYDLVTRVAELMVTSQEEKIRKKCSRILLQFLLDYRLSGKRLQQHLDFLLSNLRYEHPSGRKAVLEMLHTIIVKFPKKILDDQSQTLFLHLVVCLANDQDNEVRSMTGAAIKYLICYIGASAVNGILESSISWYLDSQSQLWSAAAQVLGLLVEAMKKGFQMHIGRVLPRARTICMSAIKDVTDRSLDGSDEAAIPFWKEAYYSLIMLEKILHECGDLCFDQDLEDVWEAICELLLHPHVWLRNVSSRLVAFYFSAVQEASRENQGSPSYSLTRPSRLFMIATSLCCQLKTKVIDNAASRLIAYNLVFTLRGVHSIMGQLEQGDPQKFWSNLEQNEQGYFLKAIKMLDSGNGQRMFLSLTSGELEKKDDGRPNNIRHLLVSNLLKRMGKTALQMEDVQMKIVFNCFSEFCSQIADEDRLLYAYEILLPLYKVCEGFAGRVISDEMKQSAQEVSEGLRKTLGISTFVQVYSEIRKSLKTKRDKRRQEEKIMAVVNPMRNAKRKLRIAAKHRAHKKRKIMTMKFGRWV